MNNKKLRLVNELETATKPHRDLAPKYKWSLHLNDFFTPTEKSAIREWALGERSSFGFEKVDSVVGRKIRAHLFGSNHEWLGIDSPLSKQELTSLNNYIAYIRAHSLTFVIERRDFLHLSAKKSLFASYARGLGIPNLRL